MTPLVTLAGMIRAVNSFSNSESRFRKILFLARMQNKFKDYSIKNPRLVGDMARSGM